MPEKVRGRPAFARQLLLAAGAATAVVPVLVAAGEALAQQSAAQDPAPAFETGSASAGMPECSLTPVAAAAPAGMTIMNVPNLTSTVLGPYGTKIRTVGGIAYVPADALADGAPQYCFVTGKIVTNRDTGKTSNFAVALPSRRNWNGKFLFQGCGGNCGEINPASVPGLLKGYPVWAIDDGHIAQPSPDTRLWRAADATWASSRPGVPDDDALTDFYHRAVHVSTEAGKQFTKRFYKADGLSFSYFAGCSDGGREGMVALSKYPDDFDGIIAGAPYFDIANEIMTTLVGVHAQLRSAGAALRAEQFALADRFIVAKCDGVDGVMDGLIQDPARCDFVPARDLPVCKANASGTSCFTQEQMDSLSIITAAITDEVGNVVYPGFSISHLHDVNGSFAGDLLSDWQMMLAAPTTPDEREPWRLNPADQPQGWHWSKQTLENFVYRAAADFDPRKSTGVTFRQGRIGGIDGMHAVLPSATVKLLNERVKAGSGATPAEADAFIRKGGKLLMYHGYSDGDITPYRTIQYYRALAARHGGLEALKKSARLFMAPGVGHCMGGPGPDQFGQAFTPYIASRSTDAQHSILTALEDWVEKGRAPAQIVATRFVDDDVMKQALRSMPLCPYPAMARYRRGGDANDAASWTCSPQDDRLEREGAAGRRAGVYAPLPS